MATPRRYSGTRGPRPRLTKEVWQHLRDNPDVVYWKAKLVKELRSLGVLVTSQSIKPSVEWLVAREFILQQKANKKTTTLQYKLNPNAPPWQEPMED